MVIGEKMEFYGVGKWQFSDSLAAWVCFWGMKAEWESRFRTESVKARIGFESGGFEKIESPYGCAGWVSCD
jgi:hypothetical protein